MGPGEDSGGRKHVETRATLHRRDFGFIRTLRRTWTAPGVMEEERPSENLRRSYRSRERNSQKESIKGQDKRDTVNVRKGSILWMVDSTRKHNCPDQAGPSRAEPSQALVVVPACKGEISFSRPTVFLCWNDVMHDHQRTSKCRVTSLVGEICGEDSSLASSSGFFHSFTDKETAIIIRVRFVPKSDVRTRGESDAHGDGQRTHFR